MVVVAVAGGTGGVGRTIVEELIAQGKHEVKIISRTANPSKEAELGAPILAVDYDDVAVLTSTLEQHNVHTLISALMMMDNAGGPAELKLIEAAEASKTTKRMVSSDYGMDPPVGDEAKLSSIGQKQAAWDALTATKSLEWTVVRNGYFMDYYGMPHFKSNMNPIIVFLDVASDMAAIPGKGDTPVAFTHTSDVARVVVASLDLSSWDQVTYIVGDKLTWNELVKMAQEAKGTKFKITHDDVESMKQGKVTELPHQAAAYSIIPKEHFQALVAAFGLWFEQGLFDIDENKSVTKRLPNIKMIKMREMLEAAWKKQ